MTTVVNNVFFYLFFGRSLAIVGESGSGKSATVLSLMRLIEPSVGTIMAQGIFLEGKDILQLSLQDTLEIRGNRMAIICQEPMTALNPVFTIGEQIMETIQWHQQLLRKEAKIRCIALLTLVGIPAPHQRMFEYPHQITGGMRQRVMIAIALACGPSVLIADELTTALDVKTQAQIMELIRRLQMENNRLFQMENNMGLILITHELGIVAEVCDEVSVMYSGSIVEKCSWKAMFNAPLHPYTQALLDAIPPLSGSSNTHRLRTIDGVVPPLSDLHIGCSFQDRCPNVQDRCKTSNPLLQAASCGHCVACFYPLQYGAIQ